MTLAQTTKMLKAAENVLLSRGFLEPLEDALNSRVGPPGVKETLPDGAACGCCCLVGCLRSLHVIYA